MIASGRSDRGLVRKNNQDSFFISKDRSLPLFILADGMGGYEGGEKASKIAVGTSKKIFKENKSQINSDIDIELLIKRSVRKSNEEIRELALSDSSLSGMGTTLIICYIFEDNIYIGHVGDSRLYYINDTMMDKLTEDHSLVNELLKKGEITEEEAKEHPRKNLITRAVGAESKIKVDIIKKDYIKGDRLLICSDGLTNMISEDKIYRIIKENNNLDYICDQLVEGAKLAGGKDNITAIVIEL